MNDDALVSEARRQRTAILESHGWDFEAMSRDAMRRQWTSGHKVVSRPRREPQDGVAPCAYPPRGQA